MTEKQAYKILTNTPIRAKANHAEYSKALHIALGALSKQIPKKPTLFMGLTRCSICKNFIVPIYKFCPDCGQAISWEGDAE
jgi:hypothetical protein